jgi:hypothetical protein
MWRKPEQHQPRTGAAEGTRTEKVAVITKKQPQGDNNSPS